MTEKQAVPSQACGTVLVCESWYGPPGHNLHGQASAEGSSGALPNSLASLSPQKTSCPCCLSGDLGCSKVTLWPFFKRTDLGVCPEFMLQEEGWLLSLPRKAHSSSMSILGRFPGLQPATMQACTNA